MQYLLQILIILAFTFLGEALAALLPLPLPASVYGLLLLFLALKVKLIRLEQVETVGSILISLLPLMFVAPLVNLMDCWETLRAAILPGLAVMILSTVIVFCLSGKITDGILSKKEGKRRE